MTTRKPLSKNEYLVIVAGFTIVLVVLLTAFLPYGRLRMTYDSRDLLDASQSVQTYVTGKNSEGHSYLVRAPLHPFLLSFFKNKMLAMWWINVLSLLASFFLIFMICRLKRLSNNLTTTVIVITVLFFPWLMNFQFFWTEPVFILLILCLSYSLLKEHPVPFVILICLLLFLTRKSGFFFFTASAVVYLTDRKWRKAITLFISGMLIFVCWQWFEFANRSTGYFGEMLGALDEYSRIFYLDAITSWFLPIVVPLLFRTILVLLVFITGFYYFRKELFLQFQQRQNVVLLSVAGVYTVIFITFTGASGYEDAERYLNVVYPLWMMMAVSIISQIVPSGTKNLRIFMVVAISLWLSYTLLRTVHHLA
jgi:hypothetical protein